VAPSLSTYAQLLTQYSSQSPSQRKQLLWMLHETLLPQVRPSSMGSCVCMCVCEGGGWGRQGWVCLVAAKSKVSVSGV
jgi:hypothetical protein